MTKLTAHQISALRAALSAKGSIAERIDAGIDACRSPEYRARLAAYQSEVAIRQELHQRTDDIPTVPTERVSGATWLRAWLAGVLERQVIPAWRQRRRLEVHVVQTQAKPCGDWGGYVNVGAYECLPGCAPRLCSTRGHGVVRALYECHRVFGGQMVRSAGAHALARAREIATEYERGTR